jgi:uncharacterized protein YfaS (alpha-2-macroglobulin family)
VVKKRTIEQKYAKIKKKEFIMKTYILSLIFTSLLFSNPLDTTKEIVPLDEPFTVDAKSPMFDDNLSYTHNPLLSCQPKLDAVYKIVSTTKLKIIPKMSLKSGTNYNCDYKQENFSFKTEPLKVMASDYFKAEKILRLSFNDNIDSDSLRDNLKLTKIDKLSKTKLQYSLIDSDAKNIVLKINESVNNSSIVLKIEKDLSSNHKSRLEKDFTKTFNGKSVNVTLNKDKKAMTIIDKPQMVALDKGGFAIRLFLEDTLEGNPKESIEVEGIENFTLNRDNYINHNLRKKFNISDEAYYYTDIISSDFQPNSHYKLTLKKGLKTYRELKSDLHYKLKSSDRKKSILFDEEKEYISNVGEVGFSSVNVNSATIIVERLLDDNLRYFINFNNANRDSIENYTKEIFSKKLTLNNKKNQILKQKFSLKELSSGLSHGVYKISLRYDEIVNNEIKERLASKILFLSDLGISLNLAKEQAFVTVLSLSSAKPISDANVELYGANNDLIATATTNKDGVAIIEKALLLKAKPKGVIVSTSSDKNFLALNKTINSPTPDEILENKERFKAHIYLQSNILRPASKINALITIKDRDFVSANELPIKLVLKEAHGKTIYEKVYHSDEFGLIEFNYQLEKEDRTGNYILEAFIGKSKIGGKLLKVEAFMPPKIENRITTNKDIYTTDALIELNISSSYLFGAPSSGLQGSVRLTSNNVNFEHKEFKDYTFSNRNLSKKNKTSYLDTTEEFTLDSEGRRSVVLSTKVTQKVPSILEAMINVTVMDDTNPVSSYKKIKIYPYKHMVGLQLSKSSFEKGQKLEGKAVLIDPLTGEKIKRKLYAVVKHITWHYDYSDGEYNWQKESRVVDNFSLNANETFSRDIPENGDYIIEVHDHLGGHSASEAFDVWWWSYSNISPKNDLKSIEINFEDRLYKKGEYLDISIKSPILEGQLFLTLESDKVEMYKHIELQKGVAKVRLPIEVDMKRGLHIHATAFRASNSSSKLIPFRAMGYKFVKPNRDAHKIKVAIETPKESKSKTSLTLNIRTDKPAKVLVSIVDKGILQLVQQEKPEIFDYFNDPSDKKLSYYDLYDQLTSYIAEGKLISFGAGDILAKRQKHLAPDLGKRVKPFMLWSGIVDLSNKESNLTIEIPEFNGRAAIVAIAINKNNIGVTQKEITIKDELMIKPSYPKYLLVGDSIEVPLRIFNTTKESKSINLSSKLTSNLAFTLKEDSITIPANSSKVVEAMLYANKIGKGEIILYGDDGKEIVSKSVELPIYSPYAISTKTFKGITNKSKTFTAPTEYSDAKVYINLSNNLIGALRTDLKYLVGYPYGCAEQTSSQLSAMHYAKAFLNNDSLVKDSKNFIRQGIKKLQNMQNYYGEFYYWSNGEKVNAYASLYAAQTLLELQREGRELQPTFVKNIINMLHNVSKKNDNYEGTYSNFHRLYAAFILAEHKALDESTANMLFEQKIYEKHFLSTLYMAAILKMQGEEREAEKLYSKNNHELSRYAIKPYGNRTGNFESNVRDMLLHFTIKTKYFDRDAKDLVTLQKEFSSLYSTQSKAVALKAISIYLGKPQNSKLNVDVSVNGKIANYTEPTTVTLEKLQNSDITLAPKKSAMSYTIELVKNLPKATKNELSKTKELSIMRQFVDENGKKVELGNLKQGDKIYSKVTIANRGELKQVVINQRVPSCLSIINNNISKSQEKFKNENIDLEYREIRDDRVLHFVNLKKKEKYDKVLKQHILLQNIGTIFTPLMVTTKGECQLPAVITEAMYDSRISDYAKEGVGVVVK